MNYYVYRYLDKKGNIIYIGLTSRPLRQRVCEHKVEELNKDTAKIQYIEVPNESQMHHREWYYIDLYKPKYNKRDVHEGMPEPRPEYDGKWIDYPTNGDVKQISQMIDLINDKKFNNNFPIYFVSIVRKRDHVGVLSNRYIKTNGSLAREICVKEDDFFSNNKSMLIDIYSQMVQIYAEINEGVQASNNGRYFNKWVNKWFEKYGVKTEKTKYGLEPINCPNELVSLFSQFEYGNKNISLFTEVNNGKRKSSTRKYICPCCGNSFRATKEIKVICMDCNEQFITQ